MNKLVEKIERQVSGMLKKVELLFLLTMMQPDHRRIILDEIYRRHLACQRERMDAARRQSWLQRVQRAKPGGDTSFDIPLDVAADQAYDCRVRRASCAQDPARDTARTGAPAVGTSFESRPEPAQGFAQEQARR